MASPVVLDHATRFCGCRSLCLLRAAAAALVDVGRRVADPTSACWGRRLRFAKALAHAKSFADEARVVFQGELRALYGAEHFAIWMGSTLEFTTEEQIDVADDLANVARERWQMILLEYFDRHCRIVTGMQALHLSCGIMTGMQALHHDMSRSDLVHDTLAECFGLDYLAKFVSECGSLIDLV